MPQLRMTSYEFAQSQVSKKRKATRQEQESEFNQLTKKYLKARGIIGPKTPSTWEYDGGAVLAMTRSEARAIIKAKLGLKRLPVGFNLEKVNYETNI